MVKKNNFSIRRCSFIRRLGAAGIDFSILILIWFELHQILAHQYDLPVIFLQLPDKLFLPALFLYFVLSEGITGTTLGKKILRIHVRDNRLRKINIPLALVRNLYKVVSILPAFMGYFMIILRKDKMALHDMLTNSVVVRIRKK
jgi:uncharacterized RDD family membrane protein YckC